MLSYLPWLSRTGTFPRLGNEKLSKRYPLNPITPPITFLQVNAYRREIAHPWLNPPTKILLYKSPSTFWPVQNLIYYSTF